MRAHLHFACISQRLASSFAAGRYGIKLISALGSQVTSKWRAPIIHMNLKRVTWYRRIEMIFNKTIKLSNPSAGENKSFFNKRFSKNDSLGIGAFGVLVKGKKQMFIRKKLFLSVSDAASHSTESHTPNHELKLRLSIWESQLSNDYLTFGYQVLATWQLDKLAEGISFTRFIQSSGGRIPQEICDKICVNKSQFVASWKGE